MRDFLRFARQQISVQLQIRTFNLYSLLLFFIQPAIFSAVGMVLSRAAGNAAPDLVYTVIRRRNPGHVEWHGLYLHLRYPQ